MTRFLKNLVLIPIAVVMVALAVANRHVVTLSLDPFSPTDQPALTLEAPLFWFLFAAIALGIFIGGVASWAKQGKWRKEARSKRREADLWHKEADRLKAARPPADPALGAASIGSSLPAPAVKPRSAA